MKKLLGIAVLCLLFTLNIQIAKSESYRGQHGTYERGTDKRTFCKSELKNKVYTLSQFCVHVSPYFKRNIEVMDGWDSTRLSNKQLHSFPRYAIFTDVTKPRTKVCGFIPYSCLKKSGDGKLYALVRTWSEAEAILDEIDPVRAAAKKKRDEQKKVAEKKRKEEEKRIAEKKKKEEKKKKPKVIPNDEKIVAASSGTGFYVSNTGHIISNHHVVEGCNAVKLTFNGKEVLADILAVDKMNDLAILKADVAPSKVYSVANEDASLLEDIIIAGYPLGKKVSAAIKTSKGSITALAGYGDNYSEFQTDAALNQGNSGGPIMNQKGNVVGVAVANYGKQAGVESFNFGIKSSTLKTFANANGLKFLPPNNRELSNKDLGQLITKATIYIECHMTIAKIKRMIAEEKNRKAFFSDYQ